MSAHKHEWAEERPWRVCTGCLLVQAHDGKRWRRAPREIQDYVRALMMLSALHFLVTHPGVVEHLGENVSRILAAVTAP